MYSKSTTLLLLLLELEYSRGTIAGLVLWFVVVVFYAFSNAPNQADYAPILAQFWIIQVIIGLSLFA